MTSPVCPQCGTPLDSAASDKPCPACLLEWAAKTGSQPDPTDSPDLETVQAAFPQLEILEKIGRGGMGTVFKARQPQLDRLVALKILSSKLAEKPTFADRFAREGKLLARLNHPNVVAVYDFGESDGFYFLLMEYVDGVNLRQAMREERFSPEQALAIVPKICDALQYAHDEGVLHRDIKPENILLDTKGRVKIADFGIGRFNAHNEPGVERTRETPGPSHESPGDCAEYGSVPGSLTQEGQILGTPNYMAPEQLDDPNKVDHRADIYSLGVVFYELLTGELPQEKIVVPSEKTPVGADVDRIVLKALDKDRDLRQQSAKELKTEIETATIKENEGPKKLVTPLNAILVIAVIAGSFVFVSGLLFSKVPASMKIVITIGVLALIAINLVRMLTNKSGTARTLTNTPSQKGFFRTMLDEVKTWPIWAIILVGYVVLQMGLPILAVSFFIVFGPILSLWNTGGYVHPFIGMPGPAEMIIITVMGMPLLLILVFVVRFVNKRRREEEWQQSVEELKKKIETATIKENESPKKQDSLMINAALLAMGAAFVVLLIISQWNLLIKVGIVVGVFLLVGINLARRLAAQKNRKRAGDDV